MLSCKETTRLIHKSMDESLDWKEHLGVKMHLLMCRFCRRFKKQLQWIRLICNHESEAIEKNLVESDSLSPVARERITKNIIDELNK